MSVLVTLSVLIGNMYVFFLGLNAHYRGFKYFRDCHERDVLMITHESELIGGTHC